MVKFLLIFLCILYLGTIANRFLKLRKLVSCLDALSSFLNSATLTSYDCLNKKNNFEEMKNEVLSMYPDISDFTNAYSSALSYSYTDIENYKNSFDLYTELLMHRNFLFKAFKESFNPFTAIKNMFSIPITLIRFLGIKPNVSFTNFINLAIWVIAFLLNLYSKEIKNFITQILKLL